MSDAPLMHPWIPTDPDDFLEEGHADRAFGLQPDWTEEYGHWKSCYAPGYREIAEYYFPNITCARFQKLLRPYVALAIDLVPKELKDWVKENQPDDWGALPPEQIRTIWDVGNAGFGKSVIACVALQALVHATETGLGTLDGDDELVDGDGLFAALNSQRPKGIQVFDHVKFHLAAFAFQPHDEAFWKTAVIGDFDASKDFFKITGQKSREFLESLANGELATIQTLKFAQQWAGRAFSDYTPGRIQYFIRPTGVRRVRACRKEVVRQFGDRVLRTS